jgi:hypothetical protein
VFLIVSVLAIGFRSFPATAAEVPAVIPGKGLVIFYRTGRMRGAAISPIVHHAQGPIGQLYNNSHVYSYFDPGSQTFWAQVISQDAITLFVEAGQTYFVKAEIRMGWYAGRPHFYQVSESKGRSELPGVH